MHEFIVLNHIGFTTDTIVQVNHALQRTRTHVFHFESHANHRLCVLRWPSQQSPHLLLCFTAKPSSSAYPNSPTCEIQVQGLVVRPITIYVSSHVVSRSLVWVSKDSGFETLNIAKKWFFKISAIHRFFVCCICR